MDNNDTSLRQKVRNFKVLSFDAMTIIEEEKEKIESIDIQEDLDVQEELQEIWNYLNTAERCFLDGTRVFEQATKMKRKVMSIIQEKSTQSKEKQIDNGLNPPITINQDTDVKKKNNELEIDNKMKTSDESNVEKEDDYITEVNIKDDNKPTKEKTTIKELIDKNKSTETKTKDIEDSKKDSKSDTQETEIDTNKSDEDESVISPVEVKQKSSTEDTPDSEIVPITSKIENDEEKDNLNNSEIIPIEKTDNKEELPTEIIEEKPPETIEEKTTEEKNDNSTPIIISENPIEKKPFDALLPTIEIPHAESNKEMTTTNTETVSESKVLLPLEEEPEENKEEKIEEKIEEPDTKEESPPETNEEKITENNNTTSPVVESKEESTIDLSFIDDNQTTDNAQPPEDTVLSFEKTTNEVDKAILVSQEQAKKLRASKESQKSIFKTIKSTPPEKKLTLEQQVEEMVNQLPILYEQGKTKEAEELSEQISILSKNMTHKMS